MRSGTNEKSTENEAASLKVRTTSLIVLELHSVDVQEINRQLQEKTRQGPDFFKSAPLLLDCTHISNEENLAWLIDINRKISEHGFIPVGITGGPQSLEDLARSAGIAIWPTKQVYQEKQEYQSSLSKSKPIESSVVQPDRVSAQIVCQPVRSGQRVYAEGRDLIVMSSVNTGAEVMSDGHIHVYGSLRGRALAGAKGWEGARIFCRDLQPDLVAIAGYYTINEDIPEDRRNSAVQISLQQEELLIDPLV